MGAKIGNTPRFVLPRIVDTVTVSKTLSLTDSTIYPIYTATKDCFVTLDFTRGSGSSVTNADCYLNNIQIGTTYNGNHGFIPADNIANFPDRFIHSVHPSSGYAVLFPMILKAGDIISIKSGGGSGSGSRTFNLTIYFWE